MLLNLFNMHSFPEQFVPVVNNNSEKRMRLGFFRNTERNNSYYLEYESGFGGLGVACWLLVPKFAGSNPAEAVGFFRVKKSSSRLPSDGK